MTQASCEKRSDVLPGQGHARSDRPLKKPVWQKKEMRACRLQTGIQVWTLKKKTACMRSRKKHALRTLDRLPVWQETSCGRSQPKRCFHSCLLSMDQVDAVWLPKTGCGSPAPAVPGKKRVECTPGCGQAAAYPQDAMCRTAVYQHAPFFFQHRCKPDTILVPRVV